MRFFFDENVPLPAVQPLQVLHGAKHTLVPLHGYDGGSLVGLDDNELLTAVGKSFDVFVTQDLAQLRHHSAALAGSGLHWIGLKQSAKSTGVMAVATLTAALLIGIPHAVEVIEDWNGPTGCWMTLKRPPSQAQQCISIQNSGNRGIGTVAI